jgi:hypothetical protein
MRTSSVIEATENPLNAELQQEELLALSVSHPACQNNAHSTPNADTSCYLSVNIWSNISLQPSNVDHRSRSYIRNAVR